MTGCSVLIMAGGTGGHIFPALAVAEELRKRQRDVVWMGSPTGMEATIVPKHGFEMEWVQVSGLRRKGIRTWISAPLVLLKALFAALSVVRARKPSVVLGMGGFVSGPGGLCAWLSGRPLVIHEQNAVAGLTNRLLARVATRVFQAFPHSFKSHVHVSTVGNPVRDSIVSLPDATARFEQRTGPIRILVLGGSQGALALNQQVPATIAAIENQLDVTVWHQAGKATLETAQQGYQDKNVNIRVDEFIQDMAEAYGWADLVVCRAGALTIAELTAAGVGAILVPYPGAVDDHQTKNAQVMVDAGAGVIVPQQELDQERLTALLMELCSDRETLKKMAVCAEQVGVKNATEVIADACEHFCGDRS